MDKNNNDFMLTTFDNPFNPFDDFIIWWKTDLLLGHDCCGTLSRFAATSEVFSDERNEQIIDEAMDEIVRLDPTLYRKVLRSDYPVAVPITE